MPARNLNAELREAASRGDAAAAKRLVLEGASVWVLSPRARLASELAREQGNQATAAAIDEAMVERQRRREADERGALRARRAMSAGRPTWVWVHRDGELRVFRRGRLAATVDRERVRIRRWLSWREAKLADLGRIEVRLGRGWLVHEVRLVGASGVSPVASRRTLAPLVDVTYDEFALWADAAWAQDLAEALSDVTGLPIELPTELARGPSR